MAKVTLDDLLELSIPEKLEIIGGLWDSLADAPGTLAVPEDHKQELDKRLAEYAADPQAGGSWTRVREEILSELSEPPDRK